MPSLTRLAELTPQLYGTENRWWISCTWSQISQFPVTTLPAPKAGIRRLQERLVNWVTCSLGERNPPNPFQELLRRAGKLQQGQQSEKGRSCSKEASSSLESWLFAILGYGKTGHKSLIRLHPSSTSGAHCSLGDTTNCNARTRKCGRSAPSLLLPTSPSLQSWT